jgi:hypothetical protein
MTSQGIQTPTPIVELSDYPPRLPNPHMLFDDAYNVVGVIDWENAHSAPFEVFTAPTNMHVW